MSEEKKISIPWNTFDYAGLESRVERLMRQAEQGSKLLVSLLEDEKKRRAALSDEEREAENKARDERRAKEKAAYDAQVALKEKEEKDALCLLNSTGVFTFICGTCGGPIVPRLITKPDVLNGTPGVLSFDPCENCLEAASDY